MVSPMFPLGTVLLPGMLLPLHVFEERYRRMMDDVLAEPRPAFGVALIERGSEVGGGDVRSDLGCLARVVEASRAEDGRWAVVAVGAERVRILRWLEDDPYPRAEVEVWPDPPTADVGPLTDALGALEARVRRLAALASELGAPAPPAEVAFSVDPGLWCHQLAVLSPLGPLDRQRLLGAPDVAGRVSLLEAMVGEQEELLAARLAFGGPGNGGEGPS